MGRHGADACVEQGRVEFILAAVYVDVGAGDGASYQTHPQFRSNRLDQGVHAEIGGPDQRRVVQFCHCFQILWNGHSSVRTGQNNRQGGVVGRKNSNGRCLFHSHDHRLARTQRKQHLSALRADQMKFSWLRDCQLGV